MRTNGQSAFSLQTRDTSLPGLCWDTCTPRGVCAMMVDGGGREPSEMPEPGIQVSRLPDSHVTCTSWAALQHLGSQPARSIFHTTLSLSDLHPPSRQPHQSVFRVHSLLTQLLLPTAKWKKMEKLCCWPNNCHECYLVRYVIAVSSSHGKVPHPQKYRTV